MYQANYLAWVGVTWYLEEFIGTICGLLVLSTLLLESRHHLRHLMLHYSWKLEK